MEIKNSVILDIGTALRRIANEKPKAGLFGFKYLTVVRELQPVMETIATALDDLLPEHVKTVTKPAPTAENPEATAEEWVKHPTIPGNFVVKDQGAYDAARREILDGVTEIANWPIVKITSTDLDRAQISLSNEDFVLLAPLLVMPQL